MRWSQHNKPCGGAHLDCDEVACTPLRGYEGNSGFWIPTLLTGKLSPGPWLHVGLPYALTERQWRVNGIRITVPLHLCQACSVGFSAGTLVPVCCVPRSFLPFCSSWDHTADLALGLTALWPNCQAASWGVPAPWNKRKSLLSSGFPSVSWKVRALWDAQRCKMEKEFCDQISCESWVEKCVKQWWFLKKV